MFTPPKKKTTFELNEANKIFSHTKILYNNFIISISVIIQITKLFSTVRFFLFSIDEMKVQNVLVSVCGVRRSINRKMLAMIVEYAFTIHLGKKKVWRCGMLGPEVSEQRKSHFLSGRAFRW